MAKISPQLAMWTHRAEELHAQQALLYFRHDVGLPIDEKKLAKVEADSQGHFSAFLRDFGREPEPIFLSSTNEVAQSRTYRLLLKLTELRTEKVVTSKYRYNGKPVNWGSWRQFAASTDDSAARKEVFDGFVKKSSILAPVVAKRFAIAAETMKEFGTDPLNSYLKLEGVNYEQLSLFVDRLGRSLRPAFWEALEEYSDEILGREAEYYDDFYFFRARIFRKYAKRFPVKTDPITQITKTMARMGLDARKVKVDSADRRGKSASAFCAPIRIPKDVRISYRKSNPLEDFTGVFHEFGHGIDFSSIPERASYSDKFALPMGVAEIFSIFFEGLMHEPAYLKSELGLGEKVVSDILRRFRFVELLFATFYSANSSMKLAFWQDELSVDAASELYSELTEKYMGIRYPGGYWLLHHVMPDYFLYSPSYLLAAVRAFELRQAIVVRYGERYWEEKDSGKFVLELMRAGRSIDIERFSKLDVGGYVESLSTGRRLDF
ncbi:MAG TPA: hypothetical protein VEJ36_08020 [Nitrososphaerales archaeon]|nr:hypothetical protein [Nitrososphaerales archaeon]